MKKSTQAGSNALALLHSGMVRKVVHIAAQGDFAIAPRGRGRPPVLDEKVRAQICSLLQFGYSRSLAAAELGLHPSTIAHAVHRDPEFREQVLTAEVLFERSALLTVMDAARHDWRAAAWVLKNYKPHKSVTRRKSRSKMKSIEQKIEDDFRAMRESLIDPE